MGTLIEFRPKKETPPTSTTKNIKRFKPKKHRISFELRNLKLAYQRFQDKVYTSDGLSLLSSVVFWVLVLCFMLWGACHIELAKKLCALGLLLFIIREFYLYFENK